MTDSITLEQVDAIRALGEAAIALATTERAYLADRSIDNWCEMNEADDELRSAARAYAMAAADERGEQASTSPPSEDRR